MPERQGRTPKRSLSAVRGRPAGPTGKRAAGAGVHLSAPSPASDRYFRHLVSSMRNGVLAVTRDGAVAFMNEVAYRTFGLTPRRDDLGRPFAEVLRDQPDVVRILASAFEVSHLPNRAELRLKPLGKVIGYTLSLVVDEQGRTAGVALFFKDLTRVEQLEERERLRDRLAALGEMAAAIAHEVKNPLAGIEVMAGLLRRQVPDSPDAQSLLADIINEAKLANRIVHEVLEFVRPIRLQVERTSIAQVLHDAVVLAENKMDRGDVSMRVTIAKNVPPIQADPHQLCQLFTNLLINALEALDGKGAITIAATGGVQDDDRGAAGEEHATLPTVMIDIEDDGPGVAPEVKDKIFNPFFTTKPQGSGLGLAIVRKIVDAHDGRIDLKTAPGQGTRFRVTLPVAAGTEWFQ